MEIAIKKKWEKREYIRKREWSRRRNFLLFLRDPFLRKIVRFKIKIFSKKIKRRKVISISLFRVNSI